MRWHISGMVQAHKIPFFQRAFPPTSRTRTTPIMCKIHFQEPGMPQVDKSAYTDKQNSQVGVIEKGYEHKGVVRPEAEARAWATVNKLHGGGKNSLGRKVPFGPVGGLGRKTNLSRSS
ncbi:MAG: hypothetical protein ACRYGA_09490 [Janthinobacterium lividum]